MFEDVVGTESVHTDIFTHGNELGSTQIIQCDIIMEQLRNSDDVGIGRGFSSRSDLYVSFRPNLYVGMGAAYLSEESLEFVALDDVVHLES